MNNRRIVFILAFALSCSLYGKDYELPLTNGYFLARSNIYQHSICNGRRIVVVPWDIKFYNIVNGYIVGYADIPDSRQFTDGALEGFFLIDSATGEIWKGLRKKNFENLLKIKRIDISTRLLPVPE